MTLGPAQATYFTRQLFGPKEILTFSSRKAEQHTMMHFDTLSFSKRSLSVDNIKAGVLIMLLIRTSTLS